MAERERVRRAIEAPVDAAAKLLDESAHADVETRLAMLIDGWVAGSLQGSKSSRSLLPSSAAHRRSTTCALSRRRRTTPPRG